MKPGNKIEVYMETHGIWGIYTIIQIEGIQAYCIRDNGLYSWINLETSTIMEIST